MRMEEDVMRLLRQTQLFAAFTEDEIRGLLDLLRAKTADYPKGSFIYREGDCGVPSAIVLRGSVHIIKEDFWGNRAILSEIVRGEMFAESYACMQTEPLAVSAAAAENCSCLFLDFSPLSWQNSTRFLTVPSRSYSVCPLFPHIIFPFQPSGQCRVNRQDAPPPRPTERVML